MNPDGGPCFLRGFADGTFKAGFSIFHKSSRKSPLTKSGLYCAFAQENLIFVKGQCADNILRIFIKHAVAVIAAVADLVIAVGDSKNNR